MGAMKRTVRYLTRKWKKSILLFAIFLVVGTLVISGISIQSASEQAATNLRRSFGGGFVMKEDHSDQSKFERRDVGNGSYAMVYTGESLTKEIADKVASVPGVSGYNAENIGPANLKTMEGDYLELKSIEGSMFANEPVLSKQANIYGYTNTQEADMFTGGSIELIEGRQITPKDQNAVLIHKELAEKNGLKLGDQFIIAMNSQITGGDEEGGKLKETVTIVGIFDSKVSQQVSVFSTPGELLENTVLMDVETSVKLLSWSSAGYYKVHYRVNDPAELNNIMQEVKKLNSIDWSCYSISTDNKTYEVATTPLDNLSGLITTLIIIITIIGVAVLILLLTMWTKSRTHESGILLSLGIGKFKIIMQHMAEVFIIAILAFGISFFTSSAVAQGLGNTLLGDTSQSSTPQNTQLEEDGSFGYTLPETPMNVDTATELSVTVVPQTFLWVFGIGGLLTVVAVLAASVPLFRLKPKQLLAKRVRRGNHMGIFQRAFLSVIRKLGKSVVLFLVLLVVSTFVLVGLSTKRTSDTAALELRHTLGGNFGLVINKANSENYKADENGGVQYTGSSLDDSVIEKVMSISGIEQYNAYQNGESEVLSSDGIPLELIKTNNQYDEDERLLHMATSESNSFSEKSNYFQKEIFQLTEGKHIGDGDTSIALISKDLAAVNHLKVGDKIMLKTMNGGAVVTLTIAGLFEIKEPQVNAGLAPPPSLYQNRIFTDNKTAKELYTNGKGEYKGVNFYVDDPAQLSNIIESVKENVNIAWDDFSIETADAEYRRSAAPLEKMSSMLSSLLLCIVVGSLLALSLMLALWMKERVHEIGVLLAMGFDKIQIIGQHIVEILLIAIVAFGISYFAGAAAANTAGNYLMTSACEQSVGEQDIEVTGKDTAPIEIDVTAPDFFAVCGIGSLVAVLSVFVSSVPVVRLKPKEILTKMN